MASFNTIPDSYDYHDKPPVKCSTAGCKRDAFFAGMCQVCDYADNIDRQLRAAQEAAVARGEAP